MKHYILILFLSLVSFSAAYSQKSQDMNSVPQIVDTISARQLALIDPDSNVVSYRIKISTKGDVIDKDVSGNKNPKEIKEIIKKLKPGSEVLYYETTGINNGILVKLPDRKYVIKRENTTR